MNTKKRIVSQEWRTKKIISCSSSKGRDEMRDANGRWIRTLSNVSECFFPSKEKSFVLFSGEGSRLPIHFQFSINVESRFNTLQRDNWISIEADLKLSPVERRDTRRVLFQIPSWMRWRKCQHLRHLPAWGIVNARLLTCMFRHGAPHESQPNKAHVAMAFPPLNGIKRKIGTEKKSNLDHGWWSLAVSLCYTLCLSQAARFCATNYNNFYDMSLVCICYIYDYTQIL